MKTIEDRIDERQKVLDKTQELFKFLQGVIPENFVIPRKHRPKLTPDQAWTVVWFIQNSHLQFPDYIERCDVCGDLYDSQCEGTCVDKGKPPHFFCDPCSDRHPKAMKENAK